MAERVTDRNIAGHRRLVVRTMVTALRSVFNDSYNRERQLIDLKITNDYPLQKVDYPCIVVQYQPQRVVNAGVGHEEWFPDNNMVMRKWHHRRFEGTLNFEVFGLSPLDRDLLSDALTEVVSFGRLDSQLLNFFTTIYGHANDPVSLQFTQIMLNADELDFGGDSASIAPWAPEDLMVYESTQSVTLHGGFYNVVPTDQWGYVTRAKAEPYYSPLAYQEGEVSIGETIPPFPDPATVWTNPTEITDDAVVVSKANIMSVEYAADGLPIELHDLINSFFPTNNGVDLWLFHYVTSTKDLLNYPAGHWAQVSTAQWGNNGAGMTHTYANALAALTSSNVDTSANDITFIGARTDSIGNILYFFASKPGYGYHVDAVDNFTLETTSANTGTWVNTQTVVDSPAPLLPG